jgi:hypothetical protein
VKDRKNVTLNLPEPLLRRFRVYAAQRDRSMTSLLTGAIRTLLDEGRRTQDARRRFLNRVRDAPDRGTGGRIPWRREELHER